MALISRKEVKSMEKYERPVVLATYTVEELVEEAAVCHHYMGGHEGGHGRGNGHGNGPGTRGKGR
jgi:hypothetical protein